MKHLASRLIAAALCLLPLPGLAQSMDAVTSARLLPGWRMADGTHMAALELRLAPGWKTYWRAPGDIGIPPRFDWRGSRNLRGVEVEWPTPEPIDQAGMTSIGYHGTVVLPLHVLARDGAGDIALDGTVEIGVCRDVCIPMTLDLGAALPATTAPRDARIVGALAGRPLTAAEAGVHGVSCTVTPGAKGGLTVRAQVTLPGASGYDMAVVETSDPNIWTSRPNLARQGDTLVAEAQMAHVEGRPFALDRSGIRLTLLAKGRAVDIKGCPAG